MRYLHTMVRVENLDAALHFYRDLLGLKVVSRSDHEQGRYTLVFLCAPEDEARAKQDKAPMVELTYNWPDPQGKAEKYTGGRTSGTSPTAWTTSTRSASASWTRA